MTWKRDKETDSQNDGRAKAPKENATSSDNSLGDEKSKADKGTVFERFQERGYDSGFVYHEE